MLAGPRMRGSLICSSSTPATIFWIIITSPAQRLQLTTSLQLSGPFSVRFRGIWESEVKESWEEGRKKGKGRLTNSPPPHLARISIT